VISLEAEAPENLCSIPGRRRDFPFLQNIQTSSVISGLRIMKYLELYPREQAGQGVKLTMFFSKIPRLKTPDLLPLLPMCFHDLMFN
jgi:hypothetical protein